MQGIDTLLLGSRECSASLFAARFLPAMFFRDAQSAVFRVRAALAHGCLSQASA